jgi:hypothetical protein
LEFLKSYTFILVEMVTVSGGCISLCLEGLCGGGGEVDCYTLRVVIFIFSPGFLVPLKTIVLGDFVNRLMI